MRIRSLLFIVSAATLAIFSPLVLEARGGGGGHGGGGHGGGGHGGGGHHGGGDWGHGGGHHGGWDHGGDWGRGGWNDGYGWGGGGLYFGVGGDPYYNDNYYVPAYSQPDTYVLPDEGSTYYYQGD